MSENTTLLDYLWSLIAIPIAWVWKINSRLTKVETTQDLKIDRLQRIEDKLDSLNSEVLELKGKVNEHLRR